MNPRIIAVPLWPAPPCRARHQFHVLAEEIEDGSWVSFCGLRIAADRAPLPKSIAMQAETIGEMPCPICRRCWRELEDS